MTTRPPLARRSPTGRTATGSLLLSPTLRLSVAVGLVTLASLVVIGAGTGASTENVASGTIELSDGLPGVSAETTVAVERRTVLVSDPANAAIVEVIAGGDVDVASIIPPGENGHTYEPVPGDAIRASGIDMYIENGMGLNDAVTKFVRTHYPAGTPEVTLSAVIPEDEVIATDSAEELASHGHAHSFNAHFWTDPVYAIAYARQIGTALAQLEPSKAAAFTERTEAFVARLQALDDAFRRAIDTIPGSRRKLVVYHDSWSYFGRRYGIPVVGAIQPVSFSEPSADEIRRMIDQIRDEAVPAFFGSEVFPSQVLDAVARETGAQYFSDLSDEELPGEPGTPEHSYEGMMLRNVRLITTALGGDASVLDGILPLGLAS